MSVRFTPEQHKLLKQITETKGEDLNDFVRRAVYKELASLARVGSLGGSLTEMCNLSLEDKEIHVSNMREGFRVETR